MFAPLKEKPKSNLPARPSHKSRQDAATASSRYRPGNQAMLRSLAQKASGLNGERCEHEAESVAHAVLDPSRKLSNVISSPSAPKSAELPGEPPAVQLLQSPGSPIESGAGSFMESRFGHSFSQVRIHDDNAAHRAASAVDARAFTL